jgi:hypothetical protein
MKLLTDNMIHFFCVLEKTVLLPVLVRMTNFHDIVDLNANGDTKIQMMKGH